MTTPIDPQNYGSPFDGIGGTEEPEETGSAALLSRVETLEAALSEALDEWEGALNFVHGAAYHASQARLDALRLAFPGKGSAR